MKILMVCEFYDPELEFQENLLVKYYRKHGHEILVLTSTYTSIFEYYEGTRAVSSKESKFHDHGAEIVRLPFRFNFFNKLKSLKFVKKHLHTFMPDLIYVHDITLDFNVLIKYVRRFPKCKMIMDYHADYSNSGKNWLSLKVLHGVIRKYYLDKARPVLQKIFPIVPAGFDFLNEIYGVPLEEMELLPLGADIDLIEEVQRNHRALDELRSSWNLSENDFVIVTGGKLSSRRQLELLLKAISGEQHKNTKLLVLGEFAPEDKQYKSLIESIAEPIHDRVCFAGWQNQAGVYQHMAIADIAVFPASQSIMWQQAIASGLPLVCGNTGNQDISYLNLKNNIQIFHGSDITADNLRLAIEEMKMNAHKRMKMASGARIVGKECLNWDILLDKTLRFNTSCQSS